MKRFLLSFAFVLLCCAAPQHAGAQTDAYELLGRVQNLFARIDDYRTDIEATVQMTGFSVPKMTATMYFKKPDRMHIESEGFAMLPRDVVGFRPDVFKKEEYDAVIQGKGTVDGVSCIKLKLLARADSLRLQRATLYVDPTRDLVLRMDADPGEGASAQADFTYTRVQKKYWLPSSIVISMDSPMRFRRPNMSKAQKPTGDGKATITMRYSNYVVNKGIPDSVFEKKKK